MNLQLSELRIISKYSLCHFFVYFKLYTIIEFAMTDWCLAARPAPKYMLWFYGSRIHLEIKIAWTNFPDSIYLWSLKSRVACLYSFIHQIFYTEFQFPLVKIDYFLGFIVIVWQWIGNKASEFGWRVTKCIYLILIMLIVNNRRNWSTNQNIYCL